MKKLVLLFLISLSASFAKAQFSLTVFYVIPPSSANCDGVIALDAGGLSSNCPPPYTFNTDCNDQSQLPNVAFSGDTLFVYDVCSTNCSFHLTGGNGCTADGVINITSISAPAAEHIKVLFSERTQSIRIIGNVDPGSELFLYNETGKLMLQQKLDGSLSDQSIPLQDLAKGIYLYSLPGNDAQGKISIR